MICNILHTSQHAYVHGVYIYMSGGITVIRNAALAAPSSSHKIVRDKTAGEYDEIHDELCTEELHMPNGDALKLTRPSNCYLTSTQHQQGDQSLNVKVCWVHVLTLQQAVDVNVNHVYNIMLQFEDVAANYEVNMPSKFNIRCITIVLVYLVHTTTTSISDIYFMKRQNSYCTQNNIGCGYIHISLTHYGQCL